MASLRRTDYINWEEYFMAIALVSAQRSKDPKTQVGACIVNDKNRIVGLGYNGFPDGCPDDDANFSWARMDKDGSGKNKHLFVCHAELNAIMNKLAVNIDGCTMYATRFPCNECAKLIIQSGIKTVVYLNKKEFDEKDENEKFQEQKAAEDMFESAKIVLRRYEPKRQKLLQIGDYQFKL
ncbi:deoxycytidylate deaminase-like [Pecten maximus]|uniref:deoxycytidylate deaminase-like n=1 Tax=Pecten maximus TaxID=6579 RepID=UPI001459000D|nr:deoxycytidylate deaminase-like [Pecten maximus]